MGAYLIIMPLFDQRAAHQQYAVVKITPDAFIRKIENPGNMPWSLFLGVLGMPGSCL
jgi:NADPH-dependent curcumin reductase CurA